ncbi:TPA: hypothetical protein JD761_002491 [Legionella pneumophila subsp. pneumophila]|nr:hypothetical protein [Legionella pneumophila subsp. pneumophila]
MDIENNKTDYAVSMLKGALGTIPVIGSFASEVIGHAIPKQRQDRIASFVREVAFRVEKLEQVKIENYFKDPLFIDLLEDAIIQSTRALTHERIEHIANLISSSISEDTIQHDKYKRYLTLLNDLTDTEIIVLGLYVYPANQHPEYYERHASVLKKEPPTFASSTGEIEEYEIKKSHSDHLVSLGLLVPKYRLDNQLKIPKFSPDGTLEVSSYDITHLGKSLIKYIQSSE